jgi:uncharacterized protein (DUF488 family)
VQSTTIWTIGHSTRSFEEFVGLVTSFNIELIVDVRSYPGSRKFPHFNKEALEVNLPQHNIRYVHIKELGGRRKVQQDSKNSGWRNTAFRAYADYMETGDFKQGIKELETYAVKQATAFMCSEAVWWRCHRSLIADYLKLQGWTVLHIMGIGKVQEHPYTAPAKVVGGALNYEKEL